MEVSTGHHNTSKKWQINLSDKNEAQPGGFAARVVALTRIGRPSKKAGMCGVDVAWDIGHVDIRIVEGGVSWS